MNVGKIKKTIRKLLVAVLTISIISPTVLSYAEESVVAKDLFISEYVEGSGYNKAIEIFNGTGKAVSLGDYRLKYDKSGDGNFSKNIDLGSVTLEHGATYVISNKHKDTSPELSKLGDKEVTMFFNGDDQIALFKGDDEIDRIGIGGDKDFAKDVTYIRKSNVLQGTKGEHDPRVADSEWIKKAKNAFDNLGTHQADYVKARVKSVKATVSSGAVASDTVVALQCGTEGAKIMYHLNPSVSGEPLFIEYTTPFTITEETVIVAKATKDGVKESAETRFTYTIAGKESIKSAKSKTDGETVIIAGYVTEPSYSEYTFIDDENSEGAIGIKGSIPSLSRGDKVTVTGTLANKFGYRYMEIANTSDVTIDSSNHPLTATKVNVADLDRDDESDFVIIEKVETITAPDKYGEVKVANGQETFRIKVVNKDWMETGVTYDTIKGVMHYAYGKNLLVVTEELFVEKDASKVRNVKSSVSAGLVAKGTSLELTNLTKDAKIYYTVDTTTPSERTTLYENPIVIDKDMTIKAIAIKDGKSDSDILTIELRVIQEAGAKTIPEIQGASHVSPYNNQKVSDVEGVVTAKLDYKFDFTGKEKITGFYMQAIVGDNNNATSDAIFVTTTKEVQIGDKVKVEGVVKEYIKEMDFFAYDQAAQLATTTIVATEVEITENNVTLPEAIIFGSGGRVVPHDQISSVNFSEYNVDKYALDFYESLESMRVNIENPLVVAAEHNRVVAVVPDHGAIAKKDGDLSIMGGVVLQEDDFNTEILQLNKAITSLGSVRGIKPGATSAETIEGILDYEWGTYQLYVTKTLPSFTNVSREVDKLDFEKTEDELVIASYNVYNHGGDDSQKKTDGIAKAIVENMKSPDIIGLLEVQDNDGKTKSNIVDADRVYQGFIDAIKAKGGPTYAWTDIVPVDDQEGGEPGGNIRVGFLYNPARVSLKAGDKGGSSETVTIDSEGHLSKNPGRVAATNPAFSHTRKSLAAEFTFKGEDVIVIANHLSSKGGDNPTYGNVQPAVLHSAEDRVKQAQLVNDFVDSIIATKSDAKVVVLGDLNDFHFSAPVKALTGQGSEKVLMNMIDELPLNEQFTYNYGGNSQVLDHIMVSKSLFPKTKVDVLNINSIISDQDKTNRHSDHDAVVVAIGGFTEEVPAIEDEVTVNIFKTTGHNGIETLVFQQGEMVTVEAEVGIKEASLNSVGVQMVITKDNKLYRVGTSQSGKVNHKVHTKVGFDTFGLKRGKYTVEMMIWDNFTSAKPLATKKEITITIN